MSRFRRGSRRPLPQELTSITLTDDNDHVLINTVPDVSSHPQPYAAAI